MAPRWRSTSIWERNRRLPEEARRAGTALQKYVSRGPFMKVETSVLQKITPDVKLGVGVKIYDFVNLYGCEIGDNTKIGTFVEVQKGAKIGKNCKISSTPVVCEGLTL